MNTIFLISWRFPWLGRQSAVFLAGILCLLLFLGGCGGKKQPVPGGTSPRTLKPYTVRGITYYPLATAKGYDACGIASWYGSQFHGRMTSSGELYNQNELTCAHTILPFQSVVTVINMKNGKSVNVRVNDRGPFTKKRIVDLSRAAAEKLGIIGTGTAEVRVCSPEMLEPAAKPTAENAVPPSGRAPSGGDPSGRDAPAPDNAGQPYFVQIGVFRNLDNVRKTEASARNKGYDVRCLPVKGGLVRILLGPWYTLEEANRALWKIDDDYPQAFLTDGEQ